MPQHAQQSRYGRSAPQRHHYRPKPEWQAGDIAFLRSACTFTRDDIREVITSKDIQEAATGHPVVILKRMPGATHVLVSPVSAYSSGDYNNYLAPWKQQCHRSKRPKDFRSFVGSEKVSNQYQALQLQDNKRMPKLKASWLHIQSVYIVPLRLLGWFDKSPDLLRLTPESLADLRKHVQAECRQSSRLIYDPRVVGEPTAPQSLNPTSAAPTASYATLTSALSNLKIATSRPSFAQIAKGGCAKLPRRIV